MTPPISRREARRSALTLLYQWDVTERALGELYEGEIDTYAQGVTQAIVRDAEELDRRITEAAAESGWTADRLPVLLPRRRLPAPLLVVVERRQVVVHEREGVHELERAPRRERRLRGSAGRLRGRKADHGPHALSAHRDRVAHRLGLAVQLRPELERVEGVLDEDA